MSGTYGVRCWGRNDYGQLGTGSSVALLSPPNRDVLIGVEEIAAGGLYTCALMSESKGVRCWGYNFYGQMGVGNTADVLSPASTDIFFP